MNTERLFNIVVTDLTSEKMKLEEELERVINLDTDTESKLTLIKNLLSKMAINETSLNKFIIMINNNNTNTKQNG